MVVLKNFLAEFVNVNAMKAISGLFANIKILPKSDQSVLKISAVLKLAKFATIRPKNVPVIHKMAIFLMISNPH